MLKYESELERRIANQLIRKGWEIHPNREPINIDERTTFIPDLHIQSSSIFGFGECIIKDMPASPNRIQTLQRAVDNADSDFFLITNGYTYDLYIRGRFIIQVTTCPTTEMVAVLCEAQKAGESDEV